LSDVQLENKVGPQNRDTPQSSTSQATPFERFLADKGFDDFLAGQSFADRVEDIRVFLESIDKTLNIGPDRSGGTETVDTLMQELNVLV
jgi:hypothetical protein